MKESKIIWALALALSVLINSVMVTWKFTRRTADDLKTINSITASDVCEKRGGVWVDDINGYCTDKK